MPLDRILRSTLIFKTFAIILCALFLVIGLHNDDLEYSYYGLIAIVTTYFAMLIEIWTTGNYYAKTGETIAAKSNIIFELLLGLIVFFGLFSCVAKRDITSNIWIASVVYYALSGVVFTLTTNIPIRMSHSGWKIPKRKF